MFSFLKVFWKRLSLTCTLLYWTRWASIGQKNSAFNILQNRLAKNDLFSLTRYSFVLQINLYRNSTSWSPTSTENFHRHFTICKTWFGKFSSTFSQQTKKVDENFHRHFITRLKISFNFSTIFSHLEYTRRWKFPPTFCCRDESSEGQYLAVNVDFIINNK